MQACQPLHVRQQCKSSSLSDGLVLLSDRFSRSHCPQLAREELGPQRRLKAILSIALIRTSFSADQTHTAFLFSTSSRTYNSRLQQVRLLRSSQQDPFSCINVLCTEKAN